MRALDLQNDTTGTNAIGAVGTITCDMLMLWEFR